MTQLSDHVQAENVLLYTYCKNFKDQGLDVLTDVSLRDKGYGLTASCTFCCVWCFVISTYLLLQCYTVSGARTGYN